VADVSVRALDDGALGAACEGEHEE
jgi:hypothetical protein